MYYLLYYGTFIILIPGIILSLFAQGWTKAAFSKYSKRGSSSGITAERAARKLLDSHDCYSVGIRQISGNLTDNYDPRSDTLSLSDSVYGSSSIAAIGVAAHECGHACQQHDGSLLLRLRSILVPVTNIGSRLAVPVAVVGVILEWILASGIGTYLINIAIVAYSLSTIFALVTLPVEINASRRALRMLKGEGVLESSEIKGAKAVLTAAAMTYVAALVTSFLYLLRFLVILSSYRRRDD